MGGTFNETTGKGSFNSMRESLSKFAQQNGFSVGFGGVARKTLDGDLGKQNIKSVSIEISQEWHKGGSVSLMYETRTFLRNWLICNSLRHLKKVF